MKRLWAWLRKFGTNANNKRNLFGAVLDLGAATISAPIRAGRVTWQMCICLVRDTEEFKVQAHYYSRRVATSIAAVFGLKIEYRQCRQTGQWSKTMDWSGLALLGYCAFYGWLLGVIAEAYGSPLLAVVLTFGPYVVAFLANLGSVIRAWNATTFTEYRRSLQIKVAKETINLEQKKAFEADEAISLAVQLKNLEAKAFEVNEKALKALIVLEDAGSEMDETLVQIREENPEVYKRLRGEFDANKALNSDDTDSTDDTSTPALSAPEGGEEDGVEDANFKEVK
jgi:hypothetical protein